MSKKQQGIIPHTDTENLDSDTKSGYAAFDTNRDGTHSKQWEDADRGGAKH